MSFLSLMFLGGAAAVAAPLIFHLIRRTPKGKQEFSTLMFLSPSPPRMTKRSRLDNWLLLLLRGLVVILLAMAFSRPFFRAYAESSDERLQGRRIALLIDCSASMRRVSVWQQATTAVKERIDQAEDGDALSLFTFDEEVETVFEADGRKALPVEEQKRLLRDELKLIEPGWRATNIGNALVTVAERLVSANEIDDANADLQIVLISDIQEGAELTALQGYDWPQQVKVDIVSCDVEPSGNASIEVINDEDGQLNSKESKVRVRNSPLSQQETFTVGWQNKTGERFSNVDFYVPAGESRSLPVPQPSNDATYEKVVLEGDDADFDNTFHAPAHAKPTCPVFFVGDDDEDDPDGLLFYLQQWATASTSRFNVKLKTVATRSNPPIVDEPSLMIVASQQIKGMFQSIDSAMRKGNLTVLVVLRDEAVDDEFAKWLNVTVEERENSRRLRTSEADPV